MARAHPGIANRRHVLCAALSLAWLGSKPSRAASARLEPWPPGKRTPPLRLTSLKGHLWDLAELRGSVVLMSFWASWCEPCLSELPQLDELARHASERGLLVLGVNYKEGAAAIRRVRERLGLSYPMLRDDDGSAFRAWGAGVLPASVLVGRDGTARVLVSGAMDWSAPRATEVLRPLLAEPAKSPTAGPGGRRVLRFVEERRELP